MGRPGARGQRDGGPARGQGVQPGVRGSSPGSGPARGQTLTPNQILRLKQVLDNLLERIAALVQGGVIQGGVIQGGVRLY